MILDDLDGPALSADELERLSAWFESERAAGKILHYGISADGRTTFTVMRA